MSTARRSKKEASVRATAGDTTREATGDTTRASVKTDARTATVARKTPRLALTVQEVFTDDALPVDRPRLRRWVRAAIDRDARLLLRIVDRAEGRTLNRDFRGIDKPTNVLTFDYAQDPVIEADIVICLPVVLAEARKAGIAAADHLAHLVIHGVLHAQGHDHQDDAEAQRMEDLEVRLLRRFGIADPYGRDCQPARF